MFQAYTAHDGNNVVDNKIKNNDYDSNDNDSIYIKKHSNSSNLRRGPHFMS